MSLRAAGKQCRINPRQVQRRRPTEEGDLSRFVHSAARAGNSVATVMGRVLFVGIALLIVTVGVLSTESNVPRPVQSASSWHTSKISRMAEGAGDEFAPPAADASAPAPSLAVTSIEKEFFPTEFVFPEIAGAPRAHGLRAPPCV